jgi:hypothetical protein
LRSFSPWNRCSGIPRSNRSQTACLCLLFQIYGTLCKFNTQSESFNLQLPWPLIFWNHFSWKEGPTGYLMPKLGLKREMVPLDVLPWAAGNYVHGLLPCERDVPLTTALWYAWRQSHVDYKYPVSGRDAEKADYDMEVSAWATCLH